MRMVAWRDVKRSSPCPPAGAPGYCPSSGGSTTYEQILNVTFIPKDDLLEVTIPIQMSFSSSSGTSCHLVTGRSLTHQVP